MLAASATACVGWGPSRSIALCDCTTVYGASVNVGMVTHSDKISSLLLLHCFLLRLVGPLLESLQNVAHADDAHGKVGWEADGEEGGQVALLDSVERVHGIVQIAIGIRDGGLVHDRDYKRRGHRPRMRAHRATLVDRRQCLTIEAQVQVDEKDW